MKTEEFDIDIDVNIVDVATGKIILYYRKETEEIRKQLKELAESDKQISFYIAYPATTNNNMLNLSYEQYQTVIKIKSERVRQLLKVSRYGIR